VFLWGATNMQLRAEENRTFIQKRKTVTYPGLYQISNFMFPKPLHTVDINLILLFQREEHLHAKNLSTVSKWHPKIPVTILVIPLPLEIYFFLQKLGKHRSEEKALKFSELTFKKNGILESLQNMKQIHFISVFLFDSFSELAICISSACLPADKFYLLSR